MEYSRQGITQSQKLMVFVLSMALFGLSNMFSELVPSFYIGVVEFSIEFFLFIPLTLAMLFDPLSAALGAATGEVIFGEIMLGQFGGLGEVEKFITVVIGVYVAGRLVSDPSNKGQVAFGATVGTALQLLMGTLVDIAKVEFAIEDFEAVAGLPESIWATEFFAFFNDMLFSGILFCILPTVILVPRLYGKIEPLLGMEPRTPETDLGGISPKVVIWCVVGFLLALGFEMLAESGFTLVDWEASWAESGVAFAVGIIVSSLIAVGVLLYMRSKGKKVN